MTSNPRHRLLESTLDSFQISTACICCPLGLVIGLVVRRGWELASSLGIL